MIKQILNYSDILANNSNRLVTFTKSMINRNLNAKNNKFTSVLVCKQFTRNLICASSPSNHTKLVLNETLKKQLGANRSYSTSSDQNSFENFNLKKFEKPIKPNPFKILLTNVKVSFMMSFIDREFKLSEFRQGTVQVLFNS